MRAQGSGLAFLIKLAVVLGLAAFVLVRVDLEAVAAYFTFDKLVAAAAIQPFILAGLCVAGWRLALLTAVRPAPGLAGFKAVVLCFGLNAVLPGRLSEILKATYLREHAGVSLSTGISAIFLERVADLLLLGTLALVAAVGLLSRHGTPAVWMALTALVVIGGLPWLAPHASRLVVRIPSSRLRTFFSRFIEHSVERLTHRAFLGVIGLSTLIWFMSLAGIATLLDLAGSIPVGISGALVVLAASIIGGAIPALPGGFGTYEAAVVFALRGYGYGLDEALALALTMHLAQLAIVCLLAPLIAMRERTGVRGLIRDAMAELRSAGTPRHTGP